MRLAALRPVEIQPVRRTADESLFNSLMEHHHYLGYEQPIGEHLKYLLWAQGGRLPVWLGVRRRGTWAAATATSAGMQKPGGATSVFWPTTVASRFCPGWRCRTWPRTFSAASPSGCRRTGSASMGTPSIFWRPLWIRNGFAGPVTGRRTGCCWGAPRDAARTTRRTGRTGRLKRCWAIR
jgi:hypothetical protein